MTAINFPDSPSNGDTHVVGGVTYTYDSTETKWKTTINSNAFLPLTGGTVSGNIVLDGELQHSGDTDTKLHFDTDTIKFDTAGSERFRVGSSGQFGIGGATYGTSGQVLTSQGSGSAPQWATPSAGGTILSSGVLRGNGGSGSGTITIASFTGLDFSAATANSRLFVMARTAIQESGNVSDTAFIDVRIDTGGSNISRICAGRNGSPHGTPPENAIAEISTSTIQALASTYHTSNVALRFRAQLFGGGSFAYGDQPAYNAFDGEEAGYTFSYALFSE